MSQIIVPHTRLHPKTNKEMKKSIRRLLDGADNQFIQKGKATKRQTTEYGYVFQKLRQGDDSFTPFPDELVTLCALALRELGDKTNLKLPSVEDITQRGNCIISDYETGDELAPHIDYDKARAKYRGQDLSFYFGESVIGVVLEADESGTLYIQPSSKERRHNPHKAQKIDEHDGSIFLLNGRARNDFEHGVTPVKEKRLSVTFRTVEWRDTAPKAPAQPVPES